MTVLYSWRIELTTCFIFCWFWYFLLGNIGKIEFKAQIFYSNAYSFLAQIILLFNANFSVLIQNVHLKMPMENKKKSIQFLNAISLVLIAGVMITEVNLHI